MKRILLPLILLLALCQSLAAQRAADTLFVRYDDRFKPNYVLSLADIDSIDLRSTGLRCYDHSTRGYTDRPLTTVLPDMAGEIRFDNPGRYLLKPNTYSSTDYMNDRAATGYNFLHSVESEHFAVFWDARFGTDPTHIKHPNASYVANANTVAQIGERCWKKYVELGFIKPGESTTDRYKIQLYIPYQTEWRADASGTDGVNGGKTGLGHFNPWAATAGGGHTMSHEVGHTFQYLVSADLGMTHGFNYGFGPGASGGCGWWESCANWQAYKVFPEKQFTDGDFGTHLDKHHLNLLHEDWRYQNFFIQDWWVMRHGADFIGRLWRESIKPEDPVEAYKRLCSLDQAAFNDEMMEGFMHMATWDIDGVRDYAASSIGKHRTFMHAAAAKDGTWEVDSAHCIQNYGYTILNLNNVTTAGTVIRAHFHGEAGASGYRAINVDKAGWRYAFVALTTAGERVYGQVQSSKDGTAELTVPASCKRLFFVVMGAPTEHWRHPWNDDASDDEQWPFTVKFENTNLLGK